MPAHFEFTRPARTRSRNALLALIVSLTAAPPSSLSACCLTDWLYGRKQAYAIAQPLPITVGEPVSPYAAGYAPVTAGYTPLLTPAPNSTVLPLAGSSIYSPSPYAVQRPAYAAVPLDNPSVYTGLPVASGYRGAAAASNSFYGTGNIYPNNYASATPTVAAAPVTSYRADMGSSVALPVAPVYAAPVRGGLSRFFDSLLGTGYRTSYYTAPITYYRPVTSVDPLTGTTVTVQQPCASTVAQVQRTPYATLHSSPATSFPPTGGVSCGIDPVSGIDPCSATATYDPASPGSLYGASPIPNVVPQGSPTAIGSYDPNGSSYPYSSTAPASGFSNGSDMQPLAPPTLPSNAVGASPSYSESAPTYSGRPSYFDSEPSTSHSNLSPLTGSPPIYQREILQDREPLDAPELHAARPAISESQAADEAYRQGYEAGRDACRTDLDRQRKEDHAPGAAPQDSGYRSEDTGREREDFDRQPEVSDPRNPQSKNSSEGSYYQLNPPSNNPPSTEETHQRSRYEIERDQRDLRELTTGLPSTQGENRYVNNSSESAPRVRPIPAPENYRNPFEVNEQLNAPDLLPSLPRPSVQFRREVDRSSSHSRGMTSENPQRLSVPVREASIQGSQDRLPTRSSELDQRPALTPNSTPPAAANAWQKRLSEKSADTGWYAKDR